MLRFKVNKGWSTAVLLFLCLLVKNRLSNKKAIPTLFIEGYSVNVLKIYDGI